MAPRNKFYYLLTFLLFWSVTSYAQTCPNTPDPTLEDANGGNFIQCSSALGGQSFNLEVTNNSSTKETNLEYTIDWGDGTTETFPASFTGASHTYLAQSKFDLVFTVKGAEGCVESKVYHVYNGTNPRFGLQNPGGSSGCVGSTFVFAVTGTDNNSPNTTYKIWFDDGSDTLYFTQNNIPKYITKKFDKGSTGKPDGFTMFGEAIDCKTSTATIGSIRISVPPVADFKVNPGNTVCTNSAVTLIDKSTGGYNSDNPANSDAYRRIWSVSPATGWSYASGSSSSSEKPVLHFNTAGKYEVTLTVRPLGSNPSCTENIAKQTIIVEDPTQAAFTLQPESFCLPSRVATKNTTPGENIQYKWSVLPAEGVTFESGTATDAEPVILFSKSGNYKVTLSATNSCGTTTATEEIVIKANPTITLPATAAFCGPQTLTYSASSPAVAPVYNDESSTITRYQWTLSGGDGVQFAEADMATEAHPTILFTKSGVYQLQVQAWNECGVSTAATQTVTIHELPLVQSVEPVMICEGGTATLTAVGNGASYRWFASATSTKVLSTEAVFTTPVLKATTSYFVEAVSENQCFSSTRTEVVVTVQPLPATPAVTNLTVCTGTRTVLSTSVADAQIEWFTSSTGGTPFFVGNTLDTLLSATTTFYVGSRSDIGNCASSARASVMVTVEKPISNNTITTLSYGLCIGSTTKEIAATKPTGGSGTPKYQWQRSTDGVNFQDMEGMTGQNLPATTLLETTWFRRSVRLGACSEATQPIKISAVPLITNNVIQADPQPICAGTVPPAITATQPEGGDGSEPVFVWESSTSKNGTYKAAKGTGSLTSFQPEALSANTWFHRKVIINGCESISEAVEIKVNPLSLPPTAKGVTICSGSTASLTATAPSGPYTWHDAPVNGNLLHTGNTFITQPLINNTDSPITFTFYVQSEATGGCTVERTAVRVVVEPPIRNNTIEEVATICAGTSAGTIKGSVPTGGSGTPKYVWEFSTDTEHADVNSKVFKLATAASKNSQSYEAGVLQTTTWFRRKVTLGKCVEYSNVIKIEVTPGLANNILPANTEFCEGTTAPLLQEVAGKSVTGGDPAEGITYKWLMSTTGANSGFEEAPGANTAATYQPENLSAPTTWFKRVAISGGCSLPSNAIAVHIIPLPALPVVKAAEITVCQGASAKLEVSPVSGISYQWFDQSGNSIGTTPAVTVSSQNIADATTYTFYVEARSGKGCFALERVPVKVTVLPAISATVASGIQTVCYGSAPTMPLTATAPTGGTGKYSYRWEFTTDLNKPFSPIGAADTLESYLPGPLTQATYYRRVVISGNCESQSSVVQVSVDAPIINTIAISGGNGEVCYNLQPAISLGGRASGGDGKLYKYLWEFRTSPNQPYKRTSASDTLATFTPGPITQDTWFRRVVTSGACTLESNVIYLHVNPVPEAPLAQGTTTCVGSTASLSATGNGVIQWLDAQGKVLHKGSSGSVFRTPVLTETTTFYAQVISDAQCASTLTAVTVEVEQKVTNNFIEPVEAVCFESAPALLIGSNPKGGSGKYTYQWYIRTKYKNYEPIPNATQANHQHGILTETVWFKRGVTSGTCDEVLSPEVEVKVNIPVAAGSNYVKAAQFIPANTAPRELVGSQIVDGNQYTYQWHYKTDEMADYKAIEGATGINYQPGELTKTTYFRRQVIISGCFDYSVPVKITVVSGFADNTISGGGQVCYNEPTNLILTGNQPTYDAQDVTYYWESKTKNRDYITLTGAAARERDYKVPALTETTIFRRKAVLHGITTVSNEIEVIVLVPITFNNITSPEQTVCVGSAPTTLVGSTPKGGAGSNFRYLWESSTNPTSGFTTAPGVSSEKDYTPSALLRDTWFRRRVISGNCLSEPSAAVKVTTTPLPKPPVAANVFSCAGNTATLEATAVAPTIEWYDQPLGGKLLHTGTTFTTPVLHKTTTYYIQTVAQSCASERVAVTVDIPAPTADAGADVTIARGKFAELQAIGGVSYSWSPSQGLNNDKIANPVAKPTQTQLYTVTVTTADGCTSTDQVLVKVMQPVEIPNGFTPNGDNMNETWEIPDLLDYPNCQVQVFNRWGSKIFESRGYNTAWDGRHNGQPLPAATYYYIIRLSGQEEPITGNVTIIK
ncbi:gliding motility-associated C-terminal domain-containing protein [Rufibacter roseus]|uniref:Gliding motility-associated C-terminal domain-containing protein n=1 Tax=Rufibacter roseus TaxID=1567108 RepID=A0ABW2DP09_9BACT|nr:gliding motility-associated C-terminal domain-containing protein [Rufibacter roseus]